MNSNSTIRHLILFLSLISNSIHFSHAFTNTFLLRNNPQSDLISLSTARRTRLLKRRQSSSLRHYNSRYVFLQSQKSSNDIQQVTLESLVDFELEGERLKESVIGWLDNEWLPQEVHVQMALSAKKSFITTRENGVTEIMDVLVQVAQDLESNWRKYDKDAFVNAWDVGNYVADYLNDRLGNESCGCSTPIFKPVNNIEQ